MGVMNIDNERKAFEAWFESRYDANFMQFALDLDMYVDKHTQKSWEAWQASANRQCYKLVPLEPTYEMWSGLSRHLGRYMQSHDRYCPKTLKKYFDRFIGEPPEWLTKEVKDWDSEHAFATADLPVFIYKAMIGACDN